MYQPVLHPVDRHRGAPVSGLERTARCSQRFEPGLAGFTLVELLVVVAISALLLALAAPAFNGLLSAQKSTALVGAFMDSLNFARSEAIKRGGRAVLCKSANGTGCSSSGSWDQGWIVFYDANNNAAFDPGEDLLQQRGATPGLRLNGNAQVASYVSYSTSGTAKLVSGAFQSGTFSLCPDPANAAAVRLIVLSSTGRARSKNGSASDCP